MPRDEREWSPRGEHKGVFEKGDILIRRGGRYPQDAWEVIRGVKDGVLKIAPKGGGAVLSIGRERAKRDFRHATPDELSPSWYPARFYMEFIEGETFEGYTDGTLWNGFATPSFELDEAKKVLEGMVKAALREGWDSFGLSWEYDPGEDALVVVERQYPDPWFIRGEDITVEGRRIRVYPVGSHSWTWHEVNE